MYLATQQMKTIPGIGAEDSYIAILQNFRRSNGLIYLIELSPCLEREVVKLASLKKQFSMYFCVRFKATG